MFASAKTALTVYGRLAHLAEDIRAVVKQTAYRSFYDPTPCEIQAERICALLEKQNIILDFRKRIAASLGALKKEDLAVLKIRFGRKKEELYMSRRTYFRKLTGALKRLTAALGARGVDDASVQNYYGKKIAFIGVAYDLVTEQDKMAAQRLRRLKPNGTLKGVFREVGKI